MSNIIEILTELNYPCLDRGTYVNTKALWRGGDDIKSIAIYKNTNLVVDYVTGQRFPFKKLVKIILGDTNDLETAKIVEKLETAAISQKPVLHQPKKFDKEFLNELIPDYSYWIKRKITKETLELFGGGVCKTGKLYQRYVFPVFNSKGTLVGVSGRDLINDPKSKDREKWKHLGEKTNWKYPLHINYQDVKKAKKIILVESIGDMLSLWDAGVKNVFVCFGVVLFPQYTSFFIKMDLDEVIVAFNNEPDNKNIGNKSANKAAAKLSNYFDEKQIKIALPTKKDFNEMSKKEIQQWHQALST